MAPIIPLDRVRSIREIRSHMVSNGYDLAAQMTPFETMKDSQIKRLVNKWRAWSEK